MSETEFRKIIIPYAIDIIAERFDNILELIHPNAFVYGGAVRDIVAGITLEGDLDIVASGADYDYCYSKIIACGKWRPCYINQTDKLVAKIKGKTSARENKIIKHVNYFETFNNRRVELIKAGIPLSKNITSSIEVVKTVDFACCGLAMDIYGNIYEVVEGAYQDCMDRILRLHNLDSTTNIEVLKDRIAKLENRGWTSKVNVDKATKALEKVAKAAEKEYKKKFKGKSKRSIIFSRIRVHSKDELIIQFEGICNSLSIDKTSIKMVISEIMRERDYKLPYYIDFVGPNVLSILIKFTSITNVKDVAKRIESEVTRYLQSANDNNVKTTAQPNYLSSVDPAGKSNAYTQKAHLHSSTGPLKDADFAEPKSNPSARVKEAIARVEEAIEQPLVDEHHSFAFEAPELTEEERDDIDDIMDDEVVPAEEDGIDELIQPEESFGTSNPHSHGGIDSNIRQTVPVWRHTTERFVDPIEDYPKNEEEPIREKPVKRPMTRREFHAEINTMRIGTSTGRIRSSEYTRHTSAKRNLKRAYADIPKEAKEKKTLKKINKKEDF